MQTQTQKKVPARVNIEVDPHLRDAINKARTIEGRNLQKIFDLALRLWLKENHPDLLPAQ